MADPIGALYNILKGKTTPQTGANSDFATPNYSLPNGGGNYGVGGLNQPLVQMPTAPVQQFTPQSAAQASMGPFMNTPSSGGYQVPAGVGQDTFSQTQSNPIIPPNVMEGTSSAGMSPEEKAKLQSVVDKYKNEQPSSDDLYNQWLKERESGTGLYALPKDVSLTPDQIFGLRSMADDHYASILQAATAKEKAASSAKAPAYGLDSIFSNLSPQMVTKLSGEENDFRSEPIVKKFNIIQDAAIQAKQLGTRIGNGPSTGSDDQRLIYLFAKAQDPDSVVREGEYATTAKYISTLPMQAQAAISRVINMDPTKRGLLSSAPTGFLTPEARKQVVDALQEQYKGNKQSYDNLRSEYSGRIDKYSGHSGLGDQMLVNYAGAYDSGDTKSTNTGGFAEEW